MTCRIYNAVTGEFGVLRTKSLQGFIDTIHERTPNGEPILVQHHPNGDWSVANACGQSPDELEGLLWESIEDHRAVISVLLAALNECADKLWVLRCNSRDPGDRRAAERACDMATAALHKAKGRFA